jgi:Nucleoside-diphosphate-sugar epimerases
MKIAVTGASGFIGRRLVPHLSAKGHEVVSVPRAALECPDNWMEKADAIIHLAGIAHTSGISRSDYLSVNCDLPDTLADAAARLGVKRFVFVSSSHAESHRHTDYGASKAEAERRLLKKDAPEIVVVRPTLVYGEDAKANFGMLVRLALLPVPLPFGKLSAQRSMVYVENLVDALEFSATTQGLSGRIFTVTDPDAPLSISDVLAKLRTGAGRSPMLVNAPWLPVLLRLIGAKRLTEKLFESAIYDGSGLIEAGWKPPVSASTALVSIGRSAVDRRSAAL